MGDNPLARRRQCCDERQEPQAFLKEMLAALDAMPVQKLVAGELVEDDGSVCALGAIGNARGLEMKGVDPEDRERVAALFGIAPAMAAEIVYMNDEGWYWIDRNDSSERFSRMRQWVANQIIPETASA